MHKKLIFFILKTFFFLYKINFTKGSLNISDEKIESNYISLDTSNINDFIGSEGTNFLLNLNCRIKNIYNNAKDYLLNKAYSYSDILETYGYESVNYNDAKDIEKIIEKTWNKENKEFLFDTRKLVEQYTDKDPFILQIGLNNIMPLVLNNLKKVIFIEEDIKVCKTYFMHKPNRCLFFIGVEIYCRNKEKSAKNAKRDLQDTLYLITNIYQKKNKQVIDILIISHTYHVAILYYLYQYLDSSTLVILMDNLNHKMKDAIFEYYDFIGEADFSKNFEKQFFNKYNIKDKINKNKDTEKYDIDQDTYIYRKIKKYPFYVITLKPKIMINPQKDHYKKFITNEYTSSYESEVTRLIQKVENTLKSNKNIYEKYQTQVSKYFTIINEFEFDDSDNKIKNKTINALNSLIKSFETTMYTDENSFKLAILNFKNLFDTMLFYVYENSKFKLLFNPLIDFFKLYINKNDSNYITYQFIVYELITHSFEIESYDLKELLFLSILRDVSKNINKLPIVEVIKITTKLNIILKKLRSRENIQHVKEYAKTYLKLDYINNEL